MSALSVRLETIDPATRCRLELKRVGIPDRQWRIDADIMLWALTEKHGWNQDFEHAES
jgi:hypothetical protein